MSDVRLYLNHLPDYDWLIALEFGRIDDGQPKEHWRGVSDHIGFLLDAPGGREVGFKLTSLSTFDDEARDLEEVWNGPRFHAPQLGLNAATVGETVLAARAPRRRTHDQPRVLQRRCERQRRGCARGLARLPERR